MSHDTPAIALKGLSIHAPGSKGDPILGPITLEIQAAEHVLIVGPSGGGKSTLLCAIAGLSIPSSGSIELWGKLASDGSGLALPPERRGVGMLFQGGALWPHMSVKKTLSFVLKNAGLEAGSARITELLEDVRLGGFEKRMPGTLSGGERQRLALARSMASEPRILLLDEPLGPLDKELRVDLLQTLEDLRLRHSWTTLHVTHDPAEAESFADRILSIQGGKLQAASQTA